MNISLKTTTTPTETEIDIIKKQNQQCFAHPTFLSSERYFFLLQDNCIVATLCFINGEYFANVCTPTKQRRKGFQKKLFNYAIEWIFSNTSKSSVTLYTENDNRGDIPRIVYKKMGWHLSKKGLSRTPMYYFPNYADQDKEKMLFPITAFKDTPINNMQWLSRCFQYIFHQDINQINFRGKTIDQHSFLMNKNNKLFTNHVNNINDLNHTFILNKIKKIIQCDKMFLCLIDPHKNVLIIQKPFPELEAKSYLFSFTKVPSKNPLQISINKLISKKE